MPNLDWRRVYGGGAWSSTATEQVSIRQYCESHDGKRPPPEFLKSRKKIEIRTGSRVLRLRGAKATLRRRCHKFIAKGDKAVLRRKNLVLQDAEHDFDKGINRIVENLANGKTRSFKDLAWQLEGLHKQAIAIEKASDGGYNRDLMPERFKVNLEESLKALEAADPKKHEVVKETLQQASSWLEGYYDLSGDNERLLENAASMGIVNLPAMRFAKSLSKKIGSATGEQSDAGPVFRDENGNEFHLFASDQHKDKALGWTEQPLFDAPDLDNLRQVHADKFQEGESHISVLESSDGTRKLVGKIERRVAKGHLKKELAAYKKIYAANGGKPHTNLGKVYGMAMVKFGDKTEEAMIMDEVKGYRGSTTMKYLHKAWKENEISSDEYWGAIQFITKRLLGVNKLLADARIVHNDYKPENFVVWDDGGDAGEPVLIDLGLHSEAGRFRGGYTDPFVAPEILKNPMKTSEKSDAFGLAATVLQGTEQMARGGRDMMPRDGLAITSKGYQQDKYGNPQHAPGRAGVETDYTRFMDRLLNPDPNARPDSATAMKMGFLADRSIGDAEAKAVIKKVLAKVPDDHANVSHVDLHRKARRAGLKDLSADSIKSVHGKILRVQKDYTADDLFRPGKCLRELAVADDLVNKAQHAGRLQFSAEELKEIAISLYARVSQCAKARAGNASMAGSLGAIRKESLMLLEDAREFLTQDPPYRPVHSDLAGLDLMSNRAQALIDLESLDAENPRSNLEALQDTKQKLDQIAASMANQRPKALETKKQLEAGMKTWVDQANEALSAFKQSDPKIKSVYVLDKSGFPVHSARAELGAAKHAQKVKTAAQKAHDETADIHDKMRAFAVAAREFLAGPGRAGLSRSEQEALRQALTTAQTLLGLKERWIAPAAALNMKALEIAAKAEPRQVIEEAEAEPPLPAEGLPAAQAALRKDLGYLERRSRLAGIDTAGLQNLLRRAVGDKNLKPFESAAISELAKQLRKKVTGLIHPDGDKPNIYSSALTALENTLGSVVQHADAATAALQAEERDDEATLVLTLGQITAFQGHLLRLDSLSLPLNEVDTEALSNALSLLVMNGSGNADALLRATQELQLNCVNKIMDNKPQNQAAAIALFNLAVVLEADIDDVIVDGIIGGGDLGSFDKVPNPNT